MDSIFISSSLTTPFASQFSPPHQNPNFPQIVTKRHSKIRILSSKHPKRLSKFFPSSRRIFKFGPPEASGTSQCCKQEEKSILEASIISNQKTEPVISITKSIVYAIVCIAVGFSPFVSFKGVAIAAPVASGVVSDKKRELLETVSSVLRVIEEVRGGNGDEESVKSALKAVRVRKEELQNEIMSRLYEYLREMKKQKNELLKRGDEIVDEVLKVQRLSEKLEGRRRRRGWSR
ncbi:hypothetical protein LWI28_016251 [Acer negundo]|uniref:Uncharacterized protein n=1 Tax=Acer negundo TaxID=4023 RepID=A0AAD5NWY3_ACENE|nr:hypothetical protein LWI28_016251 [Acer negundo]